jgi:hypothetical protein
VNELTFIGRIVATPTLRETSSGKPVTTVRIATNGTKGHCEFPEVVLWNQLASFACQYRRKDVRSVSRAESKVDLGRPFMAALDGLSRSSPTGSRHSPRVPRLHRQRDPYGLPVPR